LLGREWSSRAAFTTCGRYNYGRITMNAIGGVRIGEGRVLGGVEKKGKGIL